MERNKSVFIQTFRKLEATGLGAQPNHTERSLQEFNHLEKTWTHKTGGQKKQSDGIEDQNLDIKNYICAYIAVVTNVYPRAKN